MRQSRLSAGAWLALSVGVLAVASLVAIGAALIASHHLTQARQRVVDRVDVAANTALVLSNAMVNQETGLRGFVLGGEEQFLDPYRAGVVDARRAQAQLDGLARNEMGGSLDRDLTAARRAIAAWQTGYAQPTIDRIGRFGAGRIEDAAVARGKAQFDAVRAALARLQADLRADRADARADLASAAASLTRALVFAAVLLGLALVAIAVLGRQVIAVPIGRLARQTRAIAAGDLAAPDRAERPERHRGPQPRRRLDARAHRARPRGRPRGRGGDPGEGRGARALQRRARAVRLRRLARPPGAAAQGRELLPAARAPLRGAARRARRPVHRTSPSTAPSACRS